MTESVTENLENTSPPAKSARSGVGRRLSAAREAKGLSLAKVAEKLKLTTRQIEALEGDQYDRLPGPLFVRGFVRNYARLVELDAEALIGQLDLVQKPTETLTAPSEGVRFGASPVRRWLVVPLLVFGLFMLLVAGLYAWLSQGEESPLVATEQSVAPPAGAPENQVIEVPVTPPAVSTPTPEAAPTAPVVPPPAPEAAIPAATPALAQPAVAPPVASVPSSAIAAKPPAAAVVVPPVASVPSVASMPPVAVKPAAGEAPLRFAAQEDAWIQVVDGRGKRFSELVRAGSSKVMSGTPPFRMVVGNAAFVRMNYNNQVIDLKPFIGEKVARLTLE